MNFSKAKPGDILLFRGTKLLINKAINHFDEAYYSHAGLYFGDKKIIHANKQGVNPLGLKHMKNTFDEVLIKRLKDCPNSMLPVLNHAKTMMGNPYDYSQFKLLALLFVTRKIKKFNNPFANLATRFLNAIARRMYINMSHDDLNLICSEFPYRSYNDALTNMNDPYTIKLKKGRNPQRNYRQLPHGVYSNSIVNSNDPQQVKIYNQADTNDAINSYTRSDQSIGELFEEGSLINRFYSGNTYGRQGINPFVETSYFTNSLSLDSIASNMSKQNKPEEEPEEDLLESLEIILKEDFDTYLNSEEEEGMTEENIKKLKLAVDDFILADSRMVEYQSKKGFQVSALGRSNTSSASLTRFINIRNQFVTARDLNQATNLKDIGFIFN